MFQRAQRASDHDKGLKGYTITSEGITVGAGLSAYEGLLTGATRKIGKTQEEQLRDEFSKALGPMGLQVFNDVSRQGLAINNISTYIDSLISSKIIKKNDAENFKQKCMLILKGEE